MTSPGPSLAVATAVGRIALVYPLNNTTLRGRPAMPCHAFLPQFPTSPFHPCLILLLLFILVVVLLRMLNGNFALAISPERPTFPGWSHAHATPCICNAWMLERGTCPRQSESCITLQAHRLRFHLSSAIPSPPLPLPREIRSRNHRLYSPELQSSAILGDSAMTRE